MSLLQLPSFKEIAPMQENETDMLFKVEITEPPFFCPHCGSLPNMYNNVEAYLARKKREALEKSRA